MHSLRHVHRIPATIFGAKTALKWPQCHRYLCSKGSDIEVAPLKFVGEHRSANATFTRLSDAPIDWDAEIRSADGDVEDSSVRSVLAPVPDESKLYAEPMLRPTFHLAAYVSRSATLQQLIRLGVDLDCLSRDGHGEFIAKLDFDRDVLPHVAFLTQTIGLHIDQIGAFLTVNPDILAESLDDLQVRVNYLVHKKFTAADITRIVGLNKRWLNHSTKDIDARLGFFQKLFRLNGNQVRAVAIAGPKLITTREQQIREASFSIKEECGFTADQGKSILLTCPAVWLLRKSNLFFVCVLLNANN